MNRCIYGRSAACGLFHCSCVRGCTYLIHSYNSWVHGAKEHAYAFVFFHTAENICAGTEVKSRLSLPHGGDLPPLVADAYAQPAFRRIADKFPQKCCLSSSRRGNYKHRSVEWTQPLNRPGADAPKLMGYSNGQ